jgi:hypothetical protein
MKVIPYSEAFGHFAEMIEKVGPVKSIEHPEKFPLIAANG